ncbi:MAG: hypothetical protein M3178_02435 [Pseudomonadota bacterium]|nr:hypothetical protein [Pseudomonadota bacterium]
MIARIKTQFHLPAERTEVQSDWHYQSTETPNGLVHVGLDVLDIRLGEALWVVF